MPDGFITPEGNGVAPGFCGVRPAPRRPKLPRPNISATIRESNGNNRRRKQNENACRKTLPRQAFFIPDKPCSWASVFFAPPSLPAHRIAPARAGRPLHRPSPPPHRRHPALRTISGDILLRFDLLHIRLDAASNIRINLNLAIQDKPRGVFIVNSLQHLRSLILTQKNSFSLSAENTPS